MWSYQKPGFEALLLAGLQRQQQCSQFCDTLLKTEGVSVPAHSCVLSAISPQMSSALSSTPPPPAGQSRLLEFRALGACSLLHMVRLLYCGEMVGEGEKEKQDAISAAAKLGIHGLVEVTKRECKCRNKEEWRTEVGVQTEPLRPQEMEERLGSHVTPGPADLENWCDDPEGATRDVTAVEEWGDEQLEQFQGNIPEYISYFLNSDKEEGVGRGRARRRQGAGVGGARRGGTAERRAKTPQEKRGGRGRRGLTQTVDLQDVGVSKLQKFFLQRWGPSRTGQGGGAVGRKLYLKTRELLKSTKSGQRTRRRGKVWEFSQSGDALPDCKGGGGGGGGGRGNAQPKRNAEQQLNLVRVH
ncbi:BTB/POZ domain-containing protein 18 [Liparis tanakae]|uniref:BTB/POZ domain-containing protein 18 n=1 Tax=Liparis tanakae TaxID=230148 RepID=A0A4Z2II72_9TELE|nr:BTB/POZ domain-containing protein 18 [Liparis tanakae]